VDPSVIDRFGLKKGTVVQEFQHDADADEALRAGIEAATGHALVGEEHGDVTDAALIWYRDGDDDLADILMDSQTLLDDGAPVWLLTPKAGKPGHVPQRDIEEAASLAGLHATSTFVAGAGWTATRLVEQGHQK
jgi:hypothetical protein